MSIDRAPFPIARVLMPIGGLSRKRTLFYGNFIAESLKFCIFI